jgi:hypothetical protein
VHHLVRKQDYPKPLSPCHKDDDVLQQGRPHKDDVAPLEPELSANLWHLKEAAVKVPKHCIRYSAIHGISYYIPVRLAAKPYHAKEAVPACGL